MEESTAGYVSTILDLGGTLGAILTGVASDTLYSGASLHTAMHMCAATGLAFVFWAGACFIGATTLVHVLSIDVASAPEYWVQAISCAELVTRCSLALPPGVPCG